MNIVNVIIDINTILADVEKELSAGNEFCAEQGLVKLRDLLNNQPELEAGGTLKERSSSC
ncbi:unnamed protein product [marine sediment metagenome]|uniref:Uncharacterized protein n=1 Tax=marine sediment metagenome TaxID=412755 RepID=X1TLQ5_9ZZZZ